MVQDSNTKLIGTEESTPRKAVKSVQDFNTQPMSARANDRVEKLLSVLGEHHKVDCLRGERRGSYHDHPPVSQPNDLRHMNILVSFL